MPLNPDSHARLHALYKRFDSAPEARFVKGGAELRTDAYLAWLETRPLIREALDAIHAELKGWQPIATFFETEPETACVMLWDGEAIALGYWDDDERAWYRDGDGPDLESVPLAPTKWLALGELMRAAEFVAIPRHPGSGR